MPNLAKFNTWQEVLEHICAQKPVWYQAPLDHRPTRLSYTDRGCFGVRLVGKAVRIRPPKRTGDAFTADSGHLDRFLREGV